MEADKHFSNYYIDHNCNHYNHNYISAFYRYFLCLFKKVNQFYGSLVFKNLFLHLSFFNIAVKQLTMSNKIQHSDKNKHSFRRNFQNLLFVAIDNHCVSHSTIYFLFKHTPHYISFPPQFGCDEVSIFSLFSHLLVTHVLSFLSLSMHTHVCIHILLLPFT